MSISSIKIKRIRLLLWLYLFLLVFEGALRKWFLPFLSTPLLLVRDPVAFLAVFWAWPLLREYWWPRLQPLFIISIVAFVLAIYVGHGDWFTALFGSRIFLIQLPLIFVFPLVLNADDVKQFSVAILWMCIPMAILIAAQSVNLPNHILNIGVGGKGTSVFDGAAGKFRPPGTFSFTTGVASFFTLSAASMMAVNYGKPTPLIPSGNQQSVKKKNDNLLLKILSALGIVIALPVSISRALLANYLVVTAATVTVLVLSRSRLISLVYGFFGLLLVASIATTIPAVQDATYAFTVRWETAKGSSEGKSGNNALLDRLIGAYSGPLSRIDEYPLLGAGIGMGSNVGATRLTGGKAFTLDEKSWGRQFGELGLFLGFWFLYWRISLALWLLKLSLRAAINGNNLPLIYLSVSFSEIFGAQLGQPTGLGFLVVSAGLTLASFNYSPLIPSSTIQSSDEDLL